MANSSNSYRPKKYLLFGSCEPIDEFKIRAPGILKNYYSWLDRLIQITQTKNNDSNNNNDNYDWIVKKIIINKFANKSWDYWYDGARFNDSTFDFIENPTVDKIQWII